MREKQMKGELKHAICKKKLFIKQYSNRNRY